MKYAKTVWVNGKFRSHKQISADEMVTLLTRLLTYKETQIASQYKFSVEYDEFFHNAKYVIVIYGDCGTEKVRHEYLPIDDYYTVEEE